MAIGLKKELNTFILLPTMGKQLGWLEEVINTSILPPAMVK